MPTFEVEVSAKYRQIWTIDAEDEDDARENYYEGHLSVSEEDWADVENIKEVD